MSLAQDRARARNWFRFQVRGASGNLNYAAIRGGLTEAEVDDLPGVLTWSGIGSFLWPHCFDLAALPEEEQARVRRLVDAAMEARG